MKFVWSGLSSGYLVVTYYDLLSVDLHHSFTPKSPIYQHAEKDQSVHSCYRSTLRTGQMLHKPVRCFWKKGDTWCSEAGKGKKSLAIVKGNKMELLPPLEQTRTKPEKEKERKTIKATTERSKAGGGGGEGNIQQARHCFLLL